MRAIDNEREQVQEVFGLTGGELADEPWTPTSDEDAHTTYNYWYEGTPDYAERDFDVFSSYRTVVESELFGKLPDVLTDEQGTWRRVTSFRTSGETECPGRDPEVAAVMDLPCPLCEEDETHGFIYLGDGWAEIVYRLDRELRMTQNDNGSWHCADCGSTVVLMDDDEHSCAVAGGTSRIHENYEYEEEEGSE